MTYGRFPANGPSNSGRIINDLPIGVPLVRTKASVPIEDVI